VGVVERGVEFSIAGRARAAFVPGAHHVNRAPSSAAAAGNRQTENDRQNPTEDALSDRDLPDGCRWVFF
jgi:hypothetical protein